MVTTECSSLRLFEALSLLVTAIEKRRFDKTLYARGYVKEQFDRQLSKYHVPSLQILSREVQNRRVTSANWSFAKSSPDGSDSHSTESVRERMPLTGLQRDQSASCFKFCSLFGQDSQFEAQVVFLEHRSVRQITLCNKTSLSDADDG